MPTGRIIVSNSKKAVGVHLAQWKTQPSASLSVSEANELIVKLQAAVADITGKPKTATEVRDQAKAADAERKITFNGRPISELADEDFSDIA